MKTAVITNLAGAALLLATGTAADAAVIYGNSAAGSNNPIHYIDSITGVESQRFVPNPNGNGRGVVTVGDVVYYTIVSDPHIYKMDRVTGVSLGSILTSNASMSTIAYDGTFFWTADYSGTNRAFKIDPSTGLNVATINLAAAQQFMDGLEYFNGKLIGNRCDACGTYDIYDLSGNLLDDAFIVAPGSATGIAFDGTDFYVSNIFNSSIGVYDGVTGLLKNTITLSSNAGGFLIEDLSFDYAARADTGGGNQVPEPATLALFGVALLGLGAVRRRKA